MSKSSGSLWYRCHHVRRKLVQGFAIQPAVLPE
jgi:hypothetical protein